MHKHLWYRMIVGALILAVAIPGGSIYRRYQQDMALAYQRIASVAPIFKLFLNDFVFWSMVKLSPEGLLMALGVPAAVQQQLSPAEVTELHAFLASIEPMAARREGQLLEQRMSERSLRSGRRPLFCTHQTIRWSPLSKASLPPVTFLGRSSSRWRKVVISP